MSSPTQRALAECKKRGWVAQVVEQTIPRTFIKRDFLGIIDIIACVPPTEPPKCECNAWSAGECACGAWSSQYDGRILGIQVTSGANHAARISKARQEPRLAAWLRAGATFAVWSYAKRGERGKRKLWALREEVISE